MQMLSGNGPMSKAFQAMSPDTRDRSYRDVVVTWINRGCPMPGETLERPEGAARGAPLRVAGEALVPPEGALRRATVPLAAAADTRVTREAKVARKVRGKGFLH